jgi:hypothetical protein
VNDDRPARVAFGVRFSLTDSVFYLVLVSVSADYGLSLAGMSASCALAGVSSDILSFAGGGEKASSGGVTSAAGGVQFALSGCSEFVRSDGVLVASGSRKMDGKEGSIVKLLRR